MSFSAKYITNANGFYSGLEVPIFLSHGIVMWNSKLEPYHV